MIEFLSCRPNLGVDDLAPAAAFVRDVLGFEVEVDEPEMGLMLLRRDTARWAGTGPVSKLRGQVFRQGV